MVIISYNTALGIWNILMILKFRKKLSSYIGNTLPLKLSIYNISLI